MNDTLTEKRRQTNTENTPTEIKCRTNKTLICVPNLPGQIQNIHGAACKEFVCFKDRFSALQKTLVQQKIIHKNMLRVRREIPVNWGALCQMQ